MRRVVIISDSSSLVHQIKKRFEDAGVSIELIVTGGDGTSYNLHINRHWFSWVSRVRSLIWRYLLLWADPFYQFYADKRESEEYFDFKRISQSIGRPDAVLVLFAYRILTTKSLHHIYRQTGAKIFWFLPDMSPFTGGCSYSRGCMGFVTGCSNCPAVRNPLFKSFPMRNVSQKRQNLDGLDLVPVVFSSEQARQVRDSIIFSKRRTIQGYFPLDHTLYDVGGSAETRQSFNIKANATVILIGSASIKEPRKGISILIEALNSAGGGAKSAVVVGVGRGSNALMSQIKSFDYMSLGVVSQEDLAKLYKASDVFISASLADSGPTMVNQAVYSGVPVISFDIGVAADLIQDGVNGFLVREKSGHDLGAAISAYLRMSTQNRNSMRENAYQMRCKLKGGDVVCRVIRELNGENAVRMGNDLFD